MVLGDFLRRLGLAAFFMLTLTSLLSAGEVIKAPEEGLTFDFGTVKENQKFKHSFIFKNNSAKTLSITDISTSCGCTASEAKDTTLAPGTSTEIEVTFDSEGYSGEVTQYVFVSTDNPENPTTRFVIKARVVK